ncbi:alpha-(1,3)-fucosyltransferase 4-like [Lytechinus pictus]|uniref:alpha-(1,3)-fucosyltransferase 4-like n=1 Tax=Lytechinus pictus TaxID=7653 RepID=UPI0030B9B1CC
MKLVKQKKPQNHKSVQREIGIKQKENIPTGSDDPYAYFFRVLHRSTNFSDIHNPNKPSANETQSPNCFRQVQIWGPNVFQIRPRGIEPCPGLPCGVRLIFDTNYQTLKNSHAVFPFHLAKWDWSKLINHKPKGQKWIFFSNESPVNTEPHSVPPQEYRTRAYDYYMTYRSRYAQLYGGYGYYNASKPSVELNDTRNWASGRKGKVVWLAQQCDHVNNRYLHWNRTGFVKELSRLVDVGIYGKCGKQAPCPARHAKREGENFVTSCSSFLRRFKFYLAFENSACRDYITEKLWNNAYMNNLIPIVFGAPRADYEAVAPPHSLIHVEDFETLQDLADYINLVDRNDRLYNTYFEWKKYGSVVAFSENMAKWLFEPWNMCQVVNRLLADEELTSEGLPVRQSLPPLTNWWTNSCRKLEGFPMKIQK